MELPRRRLRSQRITGKRFDRPADVVRWMGAMQAQDYNQALWAVASRTAAADASAVERAIADAEVVATWPMRGTIHFVPARDAAWMVALTAPRVVAGSETRRRQLGLSAEVIERAGLLFTVALRGNNRMTRQQMMQALDAGGVDPAGQRGYHLLNYFAQRGLLCFGPREGKQQTFVLLDEWVPEPRQLSPEAALAEFTLRYFAGHGPATERDLAHWSGLTLTTVRRGIAANESELVAEEIAGLEYFSARAEEKGERGDAGLQLLPAFDEYLIGYRNRDAILDPEHANKVVPGGNGVFRPMVVLDGRIVGTWQRTVRRTSVDVRVTLFGPVDPPENALVSEAERYAAFLGLGLGRVTLG